MALAFMLLIYSFAYPTISSAQSLSASVNRNPVALGEQFQITFTLNGSGNTFTPPAMNEFLVLSGPNQSTSMQIVNGSFSQSVSYSYILQAKKTGTFKIGPGTVNSGGKIIQSNPITINVVAGSQSQGGQQQNNQGNISSGSVFIRVSVDKKSVYKGEAVVATFKLYTNVQVVNYSISKMPSYAGFWSQDMEMPKQMTLYNENVNGTPYQVGEIKKVVLYPQQSGILTIDQMAGECVARVRVNRNRSNNPFDIFNDPFFSDPFFGSGGVRDVPYAIKSDPVKITVKELPSGAPAGFNGAVGEFSLETLLDREKVKTNDAVNLRIKLTGRGNLKLIESPFSTIPEEFESYDPKVGDQISIGSRGATGTRTFEHLLIPRVPGNYQLGPIDFAYFNPETEAYVSLSSPPIKLEVEKGKGDTSPIVSSGGKSDFRIIGRDIKYIKASSGKIEKAHQRFFGTWYFYLLTLVPITAMIALAITKRKQIAMKSDAVGYKSRRANAMAIKRMKEAERNMMQGENGKFYEETGKAIWTYLSDRLRIPVSELSNEHVVAELKKAGATDSTADSFKLLLETCEFARFAGASPSTEPKLIYDQTIKLITDAEKELAS
ncbi:MAG: BatD family protein [Bacteroidota bacterium]